MSSASILDAQNSTIAAQGKKLAAQNEQIAALTHQLDWLRRQIFGKKSERFAPEPDPAQLHLGEVLQIPGKLPEKLKTIAAHTRRVVPQDGAESGEDLPFFDESQIPVESIVMVHEQAKELKSSEFELIGEKITYRLAQRPCSYVILKYRRPIMKRKDTEQILTAPAPSGFLDGGRADVSFAAGLLMDKFAWHLPLYLLKDASEHALLETIRALCRGESRLTPQIARKVMDQFRRLALIGDKRPSRSNLPPSRQHEPVSRGSDESPSPALSEKEERVLELITGGASNRQIAVAMSLAEGTIKNYVSRIMDKLHASTRTELALLNSRQQRDV